MSEEDAHSAVVVIPKSRTFGGKTKGIVKTKETKKLSQIPISKPSEVSMRKYLLPGRKPAPVDTFKRDELLLSYKLFVKMQERDRFKHHLGIKCRQYYKVISTDLRNRLHTDDPQNECRAITEVDPDFFLCVKGRPLDKYVPPFKSLKYMFNTQLRMRQEVGYRNDCILNIDKNNIKEQVAYNKSVQRYKEQVKHLDDFIAEDYHNSMSCLSKWDQVSQNVSKQISELQYLAMERFTMTSKIVGLDYRYGLQQKYGRFLYYLSPPSWRSRNRNFARSVEIEAKGFDYGNSSEEDTFNVIFDKLQKECSEGLVKPVLYFTHPSGLMDIFDGIEQQQLHHFSHVTQLAPRKETLKHGIKYLKDIIAQDSAGIDNAIENFEHLLEYCEGRCQHLEAKFFKILNGMFFDNVGAPDVLKFHHHLEYCYERVYNDKPINMNIFAIAKAIEHAYMSYCKRLDAVTSDKINNALQHCIESERVKFKNARIAARELRLFERLERNLLRAHEPAAGKKSVPSNRVQHTAPRKRYSKQKNVESNRQSLTEAQQEYLTLFTDWTEKEDPALFLLSLTISDDKS